MYDSSFDPDALVRAYLRPDEPILWIGQPYASVPYHPPVSSVIVALFYAGFSVFWTVTALQMGIFAIFGLPFLAIGAYMLYTITAGTKDRLRHTVYAVTPSRAMILIRTKRGVECYEHMLNRMTHLTLDQCHGSSGTIRFLPDPLGYQYGSGYGTGYMHGYGGGYHYRRRRGIPIEEMGVRGQKTSFLMIDQVQHVYRLLTDQMSGK